MKVTGLVATALLLGVAGTAGAGCVGEPHQTTAQSTPAPIPTADAETAIETPNILLPNAATGTEEG